MKKKVYKPHQVPVLPPRKNAEYEKPSEQQAVLRAHRDKVERLCEERDLERGTKEVWE